MALDFQPEIDLSVSNNQSPLYCSFKPHPGALFINAFSISCMDMKIYCLSFLAASSGVVNISVQDKAEGILVVPNWARPGMVPLF